MGEVVDFKAKVKQAQEKTPEVLPLPCDEDIAAFAYVLSYLRAMSISDTAKIKIFDNKVFFEIKHFVEHEDGQHGVDGGTIMVKSSVGEITNDEGTIYDIDVLKDVFKEMLIKVQL